VTPPVGTWEQIGIVVLFCALLIAVGGTFVKAIRDVIKIYMDGQSGMSKEWQKWLEGQKQIDVEQRTNDRQQIAGLARSVSDVSVAVERLTDTVTSHIEKDDTRFSILLGEKQPGKSSSGGRSL
jgi:NAD dependent epimerase/dehydratase family enzyme